MRFVGVSDPLPGERTAEVEPVPAPLVDSPWARPHYVTGRAVSDRALDAEQQLRMGHATLLGQALAPGVVHGLEVVRAEGTLRIEVAAGLGLCGTGEDVVVSGAVSLDPLQLGVSSDEMDAPLQELLAALTGRLPAPPGTTPPPPALQIESWYERASKELESSLISADVEVELERARKLGRRVERPEAEGQVFDRRVGHYRLEKTELERLEKLTEGFLKLAGETPLKWATEDLEMLRDLAGLPPLDSRELEQRALLELTMDGLAAANGALHDLQELEAEMGDVKLRIGQDELKVAVDGALLEAKLLGRSLEEAQAQTDVLRRIAKTNLDEGPQQELDKEIERVVARADTRVLDSWADIVESAAKNLSLSLDDDQIRERAFEEIALALIGGEISMEDIEEPEALPTLLPPFAAVLVAEPAYVDDLGADGPATDPCERDVDAEPFQDWRYVDAAAFAWVPLEVWLEELLPGQSTAWWAGVMDGAHDLDGMRNRIAWALFELERTAPTLPPWARGSVALALGAFALDGSLLFLDRAAVARMGGRRIETPDLVEGAGHPALWQARIDQLQDQLAEMALTPQSDLQSSLRWLPPAGVLPLALFDFTARTTRCLPLDWGLNAAPVPLEQVEVALREAAPLAPFDLHIEPGDELKLLLPVAQDHWDPGLLQIQTVAEDFFTALRDARERVTQFLTATAELRGKIDALSLAVGGVDALPVRVPEDIEETAQLAVASQVLWSNAQTMAELAAQAAASTVFPDQASLEALFAAAMGADGPVSDALAGAFQAVRQSFSGNDTRGEQSRNGPVVVLPLAEGAVEVVSGAGFELPGRWSHAAMAPDDPFPAWLRDPVLYLVRGEADTEALDRAVALADGDPLVVLATSLSTAAREEMDWRRARGEDSALVGLLELDPVLDADRLEDIAVRLGLLEAPASPEPGQEQMAREHVRIAALTSRAVTMVAIQPPTTSALTTRIEQLLAQLPTLGAPGSPAVLRAQDRLRMLVTNAAAVLVPEQQRLDGTREVEHAALAAALYDGIRELETEEPPSGNEMLDPIATEATYGTLPTSEGLGVELVETLIDRLGAMRSPRSDVPVIAPEELNLISGHDESGVVGVGLGGFAAVLEEKANRADDAVDFAFVQVQAAMFRLREYMTGRDKATRMATSPILAEVADLIHPEATTAQLGLFFSALSSKPTFAPTGGGGGGGGGTLTPIPEITGDRMFDIIGGIDPTDPMEDWLSGTKLGLDVYQDPRLGELIDSGVFETGSVFEVPDKGVVLATDDLVLSPKTTGIRTTLVQDTLVKDTLVKDTAVLLPKLNLGRGNLGRSGLGRLQSSEGQAQAASTGSFDLFSTPTLELSTPMVTTSTTYTVAKVIDSVNFVQALRPADFVVRSTGIAQRLEEPPAAEVTREAYRLRAAVTQTLSTLELNLKGVVMPLLLLDRDQVASIQWRALDAPDEINPSLLLAQTIIAGQHDPKTTDADQASQFSDAIRTLETVVGMLRVVEAQVRLVREAVETARRARTLILGLISQAQQREQAVSEALAEARQDLMTTSALLAEEDERVVEINARRARVLAEAVPFVVFHRVREVSVFDPTPVHDVVPTLDQDPVVEALRHPASPAPPELHEAVELWREVPARWLVQLQPALSKIDRVAPLRRVLETSQLRAQRQLQVVLPEAPTLTGLRGMAAVSGLLSSRKLSLQTSRQPAATLRIETLTQLTWQQAQVIGRAVLSVGDLIDSADVPGSLSRRAAEELDHVHTVVAALYQELSLVEPRIRVQWVTRISQFDRPLPLQDLAVLPGWEDVGAGWTSRPDPFRKRELQALVDWLFARVNPQESEAVQLVTDLVRIAILLASHAPVGRILAGLVDAPTPVQPGAILPVRIDPDRVRVGMQALVFASGVVRARAVVEDLGHGRVTTRLISQSQTGLVLQPGDTVRFVESDGVTLAEGAAAVPVSESSLATLAGPVGLQKT
jgi:hypothetical protein